MKSAANEKSFWHLQKDCGRLADGDRAVLPIGDVGVADQDSKGEGREDQHQPEQPPKEALGVPKVAVGKRECESRLV